MSKKRIVLGITGGIASGKSTVMKMLAQKGIPGISSDELAHHTIRKGTPVYRKIVKRYGPVLLQDNGDISRTTLGNIVFRNPRERRWLEKQVHPVVIRELKRFIRKREGVIALDIPLLFEAQLQSLVDQIVVINAPQSLRLNRLRGSKKMSLSDARRRMVAQLPLSKKVSRADVVIHNSSTRAVLRKQVESMLSRILKP